MYRMSPIVGCQKSYINNVHCTQVNTCAHVIHTLVVRRTHVIIDADDCGDDACMRVWCVCVPLCEYEKNKNYYKRSLVYIESSLSYLYILFFVSCEHHDR